MLDFKVPQALFKQKCEILINGAYRFPLFFWLHRYYHNNH